MSRAGVGSESGSGAEVKDDSKDAIQKDIEAMEEISKNQEDRIHNLETNALQVAGFYFVFQAVILKATWSTTTLQCQDWWYPFIPSLLAALLNIFSCKITVSKWLKYKKDLDNNDAQLRNLRRKISDASTELSLDPKIDPVNVWIRRIIGYSALMLFTAISVVILFSCHYALCARPNKKRCV